MRLSRPPRKIRSVAGPVEGIVERLDRRPGWPKDAGTSGGRAGAPGPGQPLTPRGVAGDATHERTKLTFRVLEEKAGSLLRCG